jgi:predicted nucleic acid-binding protein
MNAFVDTDVLVRHMVGDPPDQARRATRFLMAADRLLLPHVIVAETVFVLGSYYELEPPRIAELMRSVLSYPAIVALDVLWLLRALEIYELTGLHFAEAYLVAGAETTGVEAVASFDRAIDKVATVKRLEP